MVIALRPYVFQCGAAIFQLCPKSSLFRLPALVNPDVKTWMATTFQMELTALQAASGSSVNLARLQNTILQQALEETRSLLSSQRLQMEEMMQMLQRRTAVFSPTQGFSVGTHLSRGENGLSIWLHILTANVKHKASLQMDRHSL